MINWLKEHSLWIFGIQVLFLGVVIYYWMDVSVSLDYARQNEKFQSETIKILQVFLRNGFHQKSRAEIKSLIQNNFGSGHIVKEDKNSIEIDEIIFEFDLNKVKDVKLLNE